MRDIADRASWRIILSFMLCVLVIGGIAFMLRQDFQPGKFDEQAAFGGGVADDSITLYTSEGSLCDGYRLSFSEPFETAYFITYSMYAFGFSTHDTSRITVSASLILDHIKLAGYKAEDIAIVVHNHFTPAVFTSADKATYEYLKSQGFNGTFGIWYTSTKRFLKLEEK